MGKKYFRDIKGYTLLEILVVLGLIAFAIMMSISNFNWKDRTSQNLKTKLLNDFTQIEAAVTAYKDEKNSYPAGLSDATFAPQYLFNPVASEGFDIAYGTNGYFLGSQVGQPSPNNGYYICTRVTVADSNDPKFRALKSIVDNAPSQKYFYNTGCPSTSNSSDPAASTTLYPTYWIIRE